MPNAFVGLQNLLLGAYDALFPAGRSNQTRHSEDVSARSIMISRAVSPFLELACQKHRETGKIHQRFKLRDGVVVAPRTRENPHERGEATSRFFVRVRGTPLVAPDSPWLREPGALRAMGGRDDSPANIRYLRDSNQAPRRRSPRRIRPIVLSPKPLARSEQMARRKTRHWTLLASDIPRTREPSIVTSRRKICRLPQRGVSGAEIVECHAAAEPARVSTKSAPTLLSAECPPIPPFLPLSRRPGACCGEFLPGNSGRWRISYSSTAAHGVGCLSAFNPEMLKPT